MKASAIYAALQTLVEARQPVFIQAGPGLRKSPIVRKLAAVRETLLQDIRALLLDPVDLRDLPFLGGDGRAKWATPEFLPVDGEGILFLDELNAAPSMVQRDCYPRTQRRNMPSLRQPAIRHTAAFTQWAVQNHHGLA